MEVKELKNYGKGFVDMMTDPENAKRMNSTMSREFRRELGLMTLIKLMWPIRKEVKRMKKHDWSRLIQRGIDPKFLDEVIQSMR